MIDFILDMRSAHCAVQDTDYSDQLFPYFAIMRMAWYQRESGFDIAV